MFVSYSDNVIWEATIAFFFKVQVCTPYNFSLHTYTFYYIKKTDPFWKGSQSRKIHRENNREVGSCGKLGIGFMYTYFGLFAAIICAQYTVLCSQSTSLDKEKDTETIQYISVFYLQHWL